MAKTRYYHIDLLRFIAAFIVLMFHYVFRGYESNMSDLNYYLLSPIFKYGYFGVHLFFIISGFVILLSINKNSQLTSFFKNRIVRLYPAYWCCLILTFSAIIITNSERFSITMTEFLYNIPMINGFMGVKSVDGVYWSLHVEILFYLLVASFLFLKKIVKLSEDIFIISWLTLSFLPLFTNLEDYFIFRAANYFLIFEYSSFFIAGMLFYKILQTNKLKFKLLLLPCYFLSFKYGNMITIKMTEDYSTTFSFTIIISLISFYYILFYLISLQKLNFLNKQWFLKLGLLTYPLYLIHQVFGFIIFKILQDYINPYFLLVLIIIFMLVLSYIIHDKVEKPLSKKIKNFLRNKNIINNPLSIRT